MSYDDKFHKYVIASLRAKKVGDCQMPRPKKSFEDENEKWFELFGDEVRSMGGYTSMRAAQKKVNNPEKEKSEKVTARQSKKLDEKSREALLSSICDPNGGMVNSDNTPLTEAQKDSTQKALYENQDEKDM